MRAVVRALCALVMFSLVPPALAREQIDNFDVVIEVERNGDIIVAETIDVTAEGGEIRRGIFRELPRYYEQDGERLPYDYSIISVRRDGRSEPYERSSEDNAVRVRIGDPDVFLSPGRYRYELRYRVKNQVRYFDDYDEVYWNATGNYWLFPIERARARIVLPPGAEVTRMAAYTGGLGQAGRDYTYTRAGNEHVFVAAGPLAPGEGLTVAVGFEKGLIDPPSATDRGWLWWRRYGALAILLASLGGLFWFLYRSFERVGRDPVKGPVFPRYEAPRGYSPAAVHHIYYRGINSHRALIATLMHLAIKGRLEIDASGGKETTLRRRPAPAAPADLAAEDVALEARLFRAGDSKTLGGGYDAGFTTAYNAFQQKLGKRYGSAYFRWNAAYTVGALALTIAAIVFAATQAVNWTIWHTVAVLALAALNLLFMYLMPAPTPKGQQVRTEIEGFRLYMETAEKLQLNAAEVGTETPPPMTTERYERFLPYAVALGVEKPWTEHFERLIPEEAARYRPVWTNSYSGASRSLTGLSSALVATMSTGVASAMPQSSSSSGSGGGGSSGGGGGGGGGGGW